MKQNKTRPSKKDKNNEVKILGRWLSKQQSKYMNNEYIMKNEKIKKYWEEFMKEYQKYFTSSDEKWDDKLEQLKKYIKENNKRPSSTDKNKDIRILGRWVSWQKKQYKKDKQIIKDETARKWEEFMEEYKKYFITGEEQWEAIINKVKEYIKQHKKKPSTTDKNNEIKFLGKWIETTKINYVKNKDIMKDEKIRKQWNNFMEEHQKYFISNEEKWMNTIKQLKEYMTKNQKRPSINDKNKEIKVLAIWFLRQQQIYNKNKQIMKDEKIRKEWVKFIKEYQEYFMSNDEEWKNRMSQVKEYIKQYKKKPSTIDKNKENKILGIWFSRNQHNYSKKEQIMKDENVRKEWQNFIMEYKEYFPNDSVTVENDINREIKNITKTIEVRNPVDQAEFRNKLNEIYENKCIITGSKKPLEASHIIPYSEINNYDLSNGLMLRSDIHGLFDSYDITIDNDTLKIKLSEDLLNDENYNKYDKMQISFKKYEKEIKDNLKKHNKNFNLKNYNEKIKLKEDIIIVKGRQQQENIFEYF